MTGFARSGATAQTEVSSENPNYNEFVKLFNALRDTNGRFEDYIVGKTYTPEDLASGNIPSPSEAWASGYIYLTVTANTTAGYVMGLRRKGTSSELEAVPASTSASYNLYGIAMHDCAVGEVLRIQLAPKTLKFFVGLIPANIYRVSATAGILTNSGSGAIIGVAVTDTELYFNPK